ncbi:MAG: Verru_Chthon cassette protein D [Chthoniobacteraceae bacterium]
MKTFIGQMRIMSHRNFESQSKSCVAFSLVEVLVVMMLMGIMLALVVPSVSSMLGSNNLTQAGQLIVDQVGLARQIASTRNCTVEIRLIALPNLSPNGFSAMQLWAAPAASGTNDMVPVDRLVTLPQGTTISPDATKLSKLLSVTTATKTMSTGVRYTAFQIRASGNVTPAATSMSDMYLTVIPTRFADATTLPANYVIVQINSNAGTTLVYRP